MTASPAVRAQRRLAELRPKHPNITLEEVQENLSKRDHIDSTRAVSPLTRAPDARVLDNSHIDRQEQLKLVMDWLSQIHN